nr:hypothetical protein [Tanacetum cinerariifolium]
MQEDELEVQEAVEVKKKRSGYQDPEKESTAKTHAETKFKDKGKGIMVEEPKPIKKKKQVEMDEEYARKLHKELNKDIDWDVSIDHVKQKAKEDPYVQIYQFNSNIEFLMKSKEQIEEEENRAIESINETPAQKAAKRRKLNEEVEELKQHLEIVPDEDDDVYTEVLALKSQTRMSTVYILPVKIIHLNTLEMIIQSSLNIIERPIAKFVQFINLHQPVLLTFILIDESSWIGVSGVSFLAFEIGTRDDESKAFFDREICQLSLN